MTLAPPTNILAEGGLSAVSISTQPECAWTVSTQTNWISELSPASGQGNGRVEFRAEPNPVPTMREGDIVINDSQVRVRQEAAPCRFTIEPGTQTVPPDGGEASVRVSAAAGCEWTARSDEAWISIASGESGNGNGTVVFRVAANSGESRTGGVRIAGHTHSVSQTTIAPPPPPPVPVCNYAINPTTQTFPPAGAPGTPISVTTTPACAWTATSNAAWITITSGASGTGNGTVGFTVSESLGFARTGTMTIAGHAFTVVQDAQNQSSCSFRIAPTSASMSAIGGTGTINLFTQPGCAWTASNTAGWITFTTASSGRGDAEIGFLILPNVGSERSGTIAVAGHTFTVTQSGFLSSSTDIGNRALTVAR